MSIDTLKLFQKGTLFPHLPHERPVIEAYLVQFAHSSPEAYERYLEQYNAMCVKYECPLLDRVEIKVVEKKAPKVEVKVEAKELSPEEAFRELGADKQREIIDKALEGKERTEGDDSNTDKRAALYLASLSE